MDNLVSQGKEICNIIDQLLDLGEEFEIHKTMLYCKYLLRFNKDYVNYNSFKNFYERCEKYLEESKHHID